ncbi:MAG: hypothetical protein NC907_04850, partial [Candidatus Omnitrophica bacterium]|nr:hypothetical protein [Candidatus Omnitrophota bacterium]
MNKRDSSGLLSPEENKILNLLENLKRSLCATRDALSLCLVLAEVGIFDENIEKYLTLAEKKQDRNPESKTFGNFAYYLDSEKIVDLNSVEFCLREGLLLWIRHRDRLSKKSKDILERLLRYGIRAVMNRTVPARYTNIFLIKTWNMIAFGENFDNDEIKKKGYRMLDEWLSYTAENGIREYCSPNYYYNDITALGLIYNYAKDKGTKRKSEIGLRLF